MSAAAPIAGPAAADVSSDAGPPEPGGLSGPPHEEHGHDGDHPHGEDDDDDDVDFYTHSQPLDDRSLQAEVDRRNNRELTEQGVELGQYVRDLYSGGGRLFSKATFDEVEDALAADPRPSIIQIRSMNDLYRHKHVPKEGPDARMAAMGRFHVPNWSIAASFTIVQALVYQAEEKSLDYDEADESRPWTIKPALDDEDRTLATRAFTLVRVGQRHLDAPLDELRAAWAQTMEQWLRSPIHAQLVSLLDSLPHTVDATKMVCFGLGSLDGTCDYPSLDDKSSDDGLPLRASMTQHCAALTMADIFGRRRRRRLDQTAEDNDQQHQPLKILAQDPAYSPNQITLLREVGIEVVDGIGARGFTHVDEETVVFSCHPDIPVKQIIADIAEPAAMIWDAVVPAERERTRWEVREAWGHKVICGPWITDEDSARTRALIKEYDEFDFPYDRERFGKLAIYLRKHQQSG